MCTGRVDMSFVLRAFEKGADGVIIGGCWLGECHYVTEGNYDALATMHLTKKLLAHTGINPRRLRIEWVAASEGLRFASLMSKFVKEIREMGPIGKAEGIGEVDLAHRLEAAQDLVPSIKIVERESLRPKEKSEEAYNEFYETDEVNKCFDDLIVERLATNRVLLLLRDGELSSAEISKKLDLDASNVGEHLERSMGNGFVTFDKQSEKFALVDGSREATEVVSYYIDPDACQACLICFRKCPAKVIDGAKKTIHVIDQNACDRCGSCFEVCPPKFNAVKRVFREPVPESIPEEKRIIKRVPKRS